MSSTHVLIGAIVLVVVGAVLSYLQPGDPAAGALIAAGTAMLTGAAVASRTQAAAARQEAEHERQRADEAVSQTQTLQQIVDRGPSTRD